MLTLRKAKDILMTLRMMLMRLRRTPMTVSASPAFVKCLYTA